MTDAPDSRDSAQTRQSLAALGQTLRLGLMPALHSLFDALDDSLFELAQHSRQSESQPFYFDGMRACRKHRETAIEHFLDAIGDGFPEPLPSTGTRADLGLLDHDALEQHLAVSSMNQRAERRLHDLLQPLTGMLASLSGADDLCVEDNPFAPARLVACFERAIEPIPLHIEVRLILFKLFERTVVPELEPAYRRMIAHLAADGIEPRLASPSPATTRRPAANRARSTATSPVTPDSEPPVREPMPGEASLLELLVELIALREGMPPASASLGERHPSAASSAGHSQAGVTPQAPSQPLVQAIERAARRIAEGGKLPPPRQFAAQMLAEARLGEDGRVADPVHTAMVDLVGRLLDALLQDRRVARPMQPVLHRMQAPLTRVALDNPRCLYDADDPLRKAMNLLAETALGWCRSADPEERLLRRIQDAVDTYAAAPIGDEASRSLERLTEFLEKQQRRSDLAEQRVIESATGRDRLAAARRTVHRMLAERLAGTSVPNWLGSLLSRPWTNYLVLLWLRSGESSTAYRDALAFVDALLWCADAGHDDADRQRLRALLPTLESQLRTGLATVACHDGEIEQVLSELRAFISYRLGQAPKPSFLEAETASGDVPHSAPVESDIDQDQPRPEDLDPDLLSRLQSLKPGMWFEFGPLESESTERAKLSWISPHSGRLLFVNRNGMRVADRRPEEILHELERNLARVLEDANLLQAALNRVAEQFRSQIGLLRRNHDA